MLLLSSMGLLWLDFFLKAYDLKLDYVTYALLVINFTVVGVTAIFWRAHPKLTQGYLIIISTMTVC